VLWRQRLSLAFGQAWLDGSVLTVHGLVLTEQRSSRIRRCGARRCWRLYRTGWTTPPAPLPATSRRGLLTGAVDRRARVSRASSPSLPKAVRRRINALKQLQVKCAHIEAKFYEEVHDLERKYAALYQPLFDRRREFITGDVEPTDAEAEWHSEDEQEEKLAADVKNKAVVAEKEAATAEEPDPRGIPEFWFTIFRNVDMLSELVQEYDEPILKHLQDIKVKFSDPGQPMSFVLEFHFEPNDYFTNAVLTKTYKMKSEPDKADPFSFEGPEIVDCDGCAIDWKKGKNVTVKTVKKKQKHKGRGTVRTITKQVPSDSFFNFFSPLKGAWGGCGASPAPAGRGERSALREEALHTWARTFGRASGDGESLDEDSEFTLASDFEIGHFFRERIVPRAVLYFTGEAIEDDDNACGFGHFLGTGEVPATPLGA
ncbi:Nucleosome assembly protein 1-like 4, partial [Galemys pyrenaicus]